MKREVEEETGIKATTTSFTHFDSLYVRDGAFDIEWHMFSVKMDEEPAVKINSYEHSKYSWVTPEEALKMDLIHDLPESIKLFYNI